MLYCIAFKLGKLKSKHKLNPSTTKPITSLGITKSLLITTEPVVAVFNCLPLRKYQPTGFQSTVQSFAGSFCPRADAMKSTAAAGHSDLGLVINFSSVPTARAGLPARRRGNECD